MENQYECSLFLYLFIYLFICLFIYLFIYLFMFSNLALPSAKEKELLLLFLPDHYADVLLAQSSRNLSPLLLPAEPA